MALAWPTSLAQAVAPTTCTPVGPLERLAGAIEVPAALSGQVLTVPAGQTWVHHGALHLEATGRIAVLGTLVALAGPDGAPGDLVLRAPHLLIAGTLRTLSGADAPTLHGTEALVRGADGGDGGAVRLEAPDARVLAGGCIATGDGGDGGSVVQVLRGSSALPADASTTRALAAGAGGNGGDIDFAATPTVLGRFYLGNGGQGGSAIYTGSVPHGVTAVTTQGGAGGLSGFPMLGSARSLVLERALAPALAPASGDGGAGGDARSELPVASRAMGPTDIDGSNGASASQSYGSSCTLGGSDGPNGGNGAPGRDRQLGSNGDPGDPGGRGGDGTPSSAGASASAIAGPGTAGINNGGKGGSAYASGECAGPSGRGGDGGNGGSGGTIWTSGACGNWRNLHGAGGAGGRGQAGLYGGSGTARGGDGGTATLGRGGDGGEAHSEGARGGDAGRHGNGGSGNPPGGATGGSVPGGAGGSASSSAGRRGESAYGTPGTPGHPIQHSGANGNSALGGTAGTYQC